jgi:polyhydroxyalkanoate synthase
MLDFADPGEIGVYVTREMLTAREPQLLAGQRVHGGELAGAFASLRPNDLVWNYVVNNYLKGRKPPAFDLLYWNNDGTRMARAAHSFYLRNTYLENNLIKPGKISALGQPIDLRRIRQDVYAVGAEKDHIVPWRSAWRIAQLTSAKTRFVLAASGHIAGMINPPSKGKGGHWANDILSPPVSADAWLAGAQKHDGSWWTDWAGWLAARSGERIPAPSVGSAAYPPICDAPGTYVLER